MNCAMLMMTNLIMSGITQDNAASKTAQLLVDENSPHTWKASTLDKLYSEQANAEDMTMVKTFQKMWLHAGPDTKAKWHEVSAELPEACDRVKGERR